MLYKQIPPDSRFRGNDSFGAFSDRLFRGNDKFGALSDRLESGNPVPLLLSLIYKQLVSTAESLHHFFLHSFSFSDKLENWNPEVYVITTHIRRFEATVIGQLYKSRNDLTADFGDETEQINGKID